MSTKLKFPRDQALAVARELHAALLPACERMIFAGSLRRRKPEVGDIEVVYVPRFGERAWPGELIPRHGNLVDAEIARLEQTGVLARRLSKTGSEAFGPKNKLMVHVPSGIPVDMFSTTIPAWWNYVVCRTGPAEFNTLIARLAQEQGYKWHPYHSGFERLSDRSIIPMRSEREVFEFVHLKYREPWER